MKRRGRYGSEYGVKTWILAGLVIAVILFCLYNSSYIWDSFQTENREPVEGRPYRYLQEQHCEQPHFKLAHLSNIEKAVYGWKKAGIAEYESIAAFSKVSLELMALDAPLTLITKTHIAAMEEVKHAKYSLEIADLLVGKYNASSNLNLDLNLDLKNSVKTGLSAHQVEVRGDIFDIGLDTLRDGCIDETISGFMLLNQNEFEKDGEVEKKIGRYIGEMTQDEIRHASLAWVSIAWMSQYDSRLSNKTYWQNMLDYKVREIQNKKNKAELKGLDGNKGKMYGIILDEKEKYKLIQTGLENVVPSVFEYFQENKWFKNHIFEGKWEKIFQSVEEKVKNVLESNK